MSSVRSRQAKTTKVAKAPSERRGDQPPDVPDQREAHEGREEGADEAGRAVARHLDVLDRRGSSPSVGLLRRALLHAPVGVLALDMRQHGEVEGRRRRGRRPFQRAAVPGIAGHVAQLLAVADADHELRDLQHDAGQDDGRADRRDQQPGMPCRHVVVLHAPRHAHEAQDVERHEGQVEADEPAPERGLAQALVQAEAERLGEPVGVAGEGAEQHAADDDVVEVRDQEQAVVQHEVGRRHRQQHAGHAADARR